jgi:6-phosphofructokinase 2
VKPIVTLTMNPAIDVAFDVDLLSPGHKIRSASEHYDPGGGGINVARVICRLGGLARALVLCGGATGIALEGLLEQHQLVYTRLPIHGDTRLCATVHERQTGREFRIVPQGAKVRAREWQACLDLIEEMPIGTLIASGSLPPGVPADFYAHVAKRVDQSGGLFVLDSSGDALRAGLSTGTAWLVKPSRSEMEGLIGVKGSSIQDLAEAARALVASGKTRIAAVTLGAEGAIMATKDATLYLPALPVIRKSSVGAGDSFLGAMVFALANGARDIDAFKFAIAAGASAVLGPGTSLCNPKALQKLLGEVPLPAKI